MAITANMVKELREKTGAGMMDCKKALEETGGDFEKAANLLRQKGIAVAAKRETKAANEGTIGAYIHTGGKIGVLVELGCETDFVAKTDEFQALARDIAMQIAWGNPKYLHREDVPEDEIAKEREVHRQWAIKEGKPEKAIDNIVTGRMERFFEDIVLMDQPFIRDSDIKIGDLINDVMGRLGEKIVIQRFVRYRVGESG
ncbi:MAG TPA: translation elongation factor Ts [Armatimonadota bacterium]|nr:translation elongation factor Ts [Armatimonadota bacterium]HPP75217.1 translation elongation factor Ts [Armatimonadota bacterium]